MDRFKLLLSGLFFVFLIIEGLDTTQPRNYAPFYLAGILITGLILDWYYWSRPVFLSSHRKKIRANSILSTENSIFQLLGNLMRSYGLEMRLRRAEFLWNVTLLKNIGGITRMVGRGSAPSISEAIMRAEGDFEKHNNTPISS